MSKGDYLGEFEIVVLSTLLHLGDNAYGMTIRCVIDERTGRSVSIGAIYATLRRLERKGLVTSHLGEPTAERGGRAKRFFGLEPAGEVAVARSRAMFARLWDDLPETH
jgi:PadR family transcriptional regulator PadR